MYIRTKDAGGKRYGKENILKFVEGMRKDKKIMSEKENCIRRFLKEKGFARTQVGFVYMSEAIQMCMENEVITAKGIASNIGELHSVKDGQVLSALNYSLSYAKSKGNIDASLLPFIRESADYIKLTFIKED